MTKTLVTSDSLMTALKWRYATKQFDSEKVLSEAERSTLQEVVRMAPSSFGVQPWTFVWVRDAEVRKKLAPQAWNQPQITEASELVVLCRRTDIDAGHVDRFVGTTAQARQVQPQDLDGLREMVLGFLSDKSPEAIAEWSSKQVYIALGMLLETAALMGIDACPMEGFSREGFDEVLGLKEKGMASVVLCALGHRSAKDAYAKEAKSRFRLEDVVVNVG